MKLKDLVKKLQGKPNQNEEVEFVVYQAGDGILVCADLTGPSTTELLKVLSKRGKKK